MGITLLVGACWWIGYRERRIKEDAFGLGSWENGNIYQNGKDKRGHVSDEKVIKISFLDRVTLRCSLDAQVKMAVKQVNVGGGDQERD